jgi:hypothetical protein
VKLYVEGGGETSTLKTDCRAGFSEFLRKAGLEGCMPRIVACGSRNDAFDSFRTAVSLGEPACLLVDSEVAVGDLNQQGKPDQWKPWEHLNQRDKWEKPQSASGLDCHLMVQCMEAWFVADRETAASFFGQGFKMNKFPDVARSIETVPKEQLYDALKNATKECRKGRYDKGSHSFKLLAKLDPGKVASSSPWAKRLIDTLKESRRRTDRF